MGLSSRNGRSGMDRNVRSGTGVPWQPQRLLRHRHPVDVRLAVPSVDLHQSPAVQLRQVLVDRPDRHPHLSSKSLLSDERQEVLHRVHRQEREHHLGWRRQCRVCQNFVRDLCEPIRPVHQKILLTGVACREGRVSFISVHLTGLSRPPRRYKPGRSLYVQPPVEDR